MARRALVIGLGSSGVQVCNDLMERVAWEYGDAGRFPFVDFLGIETLIAGQGETRTEEDEKLVQNQKRLAESGKMIYITLKADDVHSLRNNPDSFKESCGLNDWLDKGILTGKSAIERGAGNNRMIGRLCFLYPSNLSVTYNRIKDVLSGLAKADNPNMATIKRGSGTVSFNLTPGASVYVVGTLCGGTASGCFVDLGYLLQNLRQTGPMNIEINGIFALPDAGMPNEHLMANASSALTELNHYCSDEGHYSQRLMLPGVRDLDMPGQTPYDSHCLVAARDSSDMSLQLLWTQCAQYIWTDLFSEVGDDRAAKRVDFLDAARDGDGAGFNQHFSTFGVSSVEYPATQIIKGCSYRLIDSAVAAITADRSIPRADAESAVKGLGIDSQQIQDAVLSVAGKPSVAQVINSALDTSIAKWGSTSDLLAGEASIDLAFGIRSDAKVLESLPPKLIPSTIEINSAPVISGLSKALWQQLTSSLTDPEQGIPYCHALLSEVAAFVQRRKDEVGNPKLRSSIEEAAKNKNHAIAQIDTVLSDVVSKLFLLDSIAVRHYEEEYSYWVRQYFSLRLRVEADAAELYVLQELDTECAALRVRLGNFAQLLSVASKEARKTYEDCRDHDPKINGCCLFERGSSAPHARPGTVDTEYQKSLGTRNSDERSAVVRVLKGMQSLLDGFKTPVGQNGPLDSENGRPAKFARFSASIMGSLEVLASQSFEQLRDTNIIDLLMVDPDAAQEKFRKAWSMSQLCIDVPVTAEHFRGRNVDNRKYYRLAFFRNARTARKRAATAMPDDYEAILSAWLTREITNDGLGIQVWGDLAEPTRIIFLREHGAFPLRVVPQLRALARTEQQYLQESGAATLSSRLDARWMPRDLAERKDFERALQMLILGISTLVMAVPPGKTEYEFTSAEFGYATTVSRDLGSAAAQLRHDEAFPDVMDRTIKGLAARQGYATVTMRLANFLDKFTAFGITGVEAEKAKELVLAYIETDSQDPDLWTEWMQTMKAKRGHLLKPEDPVTGRPSAYCCPHCSVYWLDHMDIPEMCPGCGKKVI